MKLTKLHQAIIGVVIIFFAGALTQYVLLKGTNNKISSTKSEIEKLNGQIRTAQEIQDVALQLQEEMAHLKDQLERLKKILPSSINEAKFLSDIKRYANENGIEILVITNAKPVVDGVIEEHSFSFSTRGGYHDYGNFFAQLTNYQRIVNVKALSIARTKKSKTYSVGAVFAVSVFTYREPTEEELRAELKEKKGKKGDK